MKHFIVYLSLILCSWSTAGSSADVLQLPNKKAAVNTSKGKLTGRLQTIEVSYAAISCPCAQWIQANYRGKDPLDKYIYLERVNDKMGDANMLWDGSTLPFRLRLKGYFYERKGFPRGYKPAKGSPEPARVFQYNSLEVLNR